MPRLFPIRRPTPLALAAAAMATLLLALAGLQYRWVGQLSADERERLRAHVAVQADSLSDDFNRELTRAFFWLQFGPELRRDLPPEGEADRYARWYAAAPRPELIKAIYRVTEPARDGAPWLIERFTREPAGLEAVAWPAALEPLRATMEEARKARGRTDKQPIRVPATWAALPALVMPRIAQVEERGPGGRVLSLTVPLHGYTIAVLDTAVIKNDLLPQLVERHFKLSEDPTLFVGVFGPGFAYTAPAGAVPAALQAAPDIKQGDLFEVRFREFSRFVTDRRFAPNPAAATTAATGGSGGANAPGGAGSIPVPSPGGGSPIVIARDERGGGNLFRMPGPSGGPGGPASAPHWQVHVLHRAGSLDAAVSHARLRNLLVSFGTLLLLGASMGLVLVTTGRARRLAAQQLEFVAGVSHELRTPLAVIRSAAENLADGVVADPKQVKRYGEVIAGEGRRLTHMVEQIMEFAGFESGRVSLDVHPVEPGGLIEEALRAAAPHVHEHHATIERTGAAELPAVLVDAAAISRSLQNLIVNALKYGGAPPAVVLDVRPGEPGRREVDVTVSDNGAGIAARDLPHIFEPFYRGADARARQIHGSGLGLSLVKRIMDEIGGRVSVRSDAKGSAFTLHLPVAPEGAREAGAAGQVVASLSGPRVTTS